MGNVRRLFMGQEAPQGGWISGIPLWGSSGWPLKGVGFPIYDNWEKSRINPQETTAIHREPQGDRFYLSKSPRVALQRAILLQILEVIYFASHYGGRIIKTCFLIRYSKRLVKRDTTKNGEADVNLFWKVWGWERGQSRAKTPTLSNHCHMYSLLALQVFPSIPQ